MNRSHILPLTVLVCGLVSIDAYAQRQPSSGFLEVDVQIRYQDGSAAPAGLHVVLESAEGGFATDCQTMEGGKCRLRPAATGVYTVVLRQAGYAEVSQRVELVGLLHAFVTLTLQPSDRNAGTPRTSSTPSGEMSVDDLGIPEKARQEFAKGEDALRAKDPGKATKHLEKAVKTYDNYPRAYWMLGEAYIEQQAWDKAREALTKSISRDPNFAPAYIDLGAVHNQLKNYPEAEKALTKGLQLSPDAASAKYELAKTFWATNRWQQAAPLAEAVVKETPNVAGAHVLYGNILLKRGDRQGAVAEYNEYLRLEPNGSMAAGVHEAISKLQNPPPK